MSQIKENIQRIQEEILNSCIKSNRNPDSVTLIAVTKTKPVEDMQIAYDCGLHNFGENKVQEIQAKYPSFGDKPIWHMIGHLQTNKVKYIIDKVSLIHSVDSLNLAKVIDAQAKKHNKIQDILIQINVANEDTKFGITEEEVEPLIREIAKFENVKIRGLMTIAPYVVDSEQNRPIFRKMSQIFVDINQKNIDNVNMDTLSMGMTNDYQVAIEEGATMIRIGTAIFGDRNYSLEG